MIMPTKSQTAVKVIAIFMLFAMLGLNACTNGSTDEKKADQATPAVVDTVKKGPDTIGVKSASDTPKNTIDTSGRGTVVPKQ